MINLAIAGVIVFFFHLFIKKFFVKRKPRDKEIVASQETAENQELIKFLKGYCLFYLFILLFSLIVIILVAIFFPHFYRQLSSSIFGERFISVVIFVYLILWIVVLTYLYKVSRLLKLSGNLGIRPSLIVIFTIVASYTFPLLAFIPFLVIWIKSNAYLRYETKNVFN
jgi:H+/gluconate symporter-like permease